MHGIDTDSQPNEDEAGQPIRLGPPGWDEFSAARERFKQTVAVAGLETAWLAPSHEPRSRGVGSP